MWNERYDRPDYLFGTEPAAFLSLHGSLIPKGSKVLVVADGEGRNSVWLAGQGHSVVAFDNSDVGQAKARALADARGVQVDFRNADIFAFDWDAEQYDAVVAIFIQFMGPKEREGVFEGMKRALRPGGLLMLHGYAPRQVEYGTGGPGRVENMYTLPQLEHSFDGFEVLHKADYDAEVDEGEGHSGTSGLIDFIVHKPK